MEAFQFSNMDYLYLLLIIPVLVIIFAIARQLRKRALKNFGDFEVINPLMPDVSVSRPVWKFVFIIFALFFLILAIARPQFGAKLQEIKRRGVEIIIALDVSNSMLAQDVKPSRLENAKLAISKLVEKLQEDKLGLIVFAGDSYTQIPITTDYSAIDMFLESVNTGIVPVQGTAIGSAVELGMKSFSPDNDKSKVMIIITDGEDHEANAIAKAKEAAGQGIIVHTIGMGKPEGAPIPVRGTSDFRRDREGNIVISKLNPAILKQISSAGGGIFVHATNTTSALRTIYNEIDEMEKQEMEAKIFSEFDEKFQILIALALIFLVFEFLLMERKNKYLKNIRLFK